MLSLQISDIRQFMTSLLSLETFDHFLLVEATVKMSVTHRIDGRINKEFYESDPAPEQDYISWGNVRDYVFSVIRGKQLPLSMKIILALPQPTIQALLTQNGLSERIRDIEGMYLNILYTPANLVLTTGISDKGFSLDRLADSILEESVRGFLRKHELA